ncbi:MAG: transcription-repair coupling factor [Magnetococcales bacterium]|nr:transcription-repair coupling factor [Magnetococcales bacterium]
MTIPGPFRPSLEALLARFSPAAGSRLPPVAVPGSAGRWLASELAERTGAPLVLVTGKNSRAEACLRELIFFNRHHPRAIPLLPFPAWEVLPFEGLSPFGPLVAERLTTLHRLNRMRPGGPIQATDGSGQVRGIVVTTAAALMQRLMPRATLASHGYAIAVGDQLDLPAFRQFLTVSGYRLAHQVSEPGEFAVRGGIVDLFPPGRDEPLRLDLMGDEVDSLFRLDPVTQRSTDPVPSLEVLPFREVLLNEATISAFRTGYREIFGGKAAGDGIYKSVSEGLPSQGMEHYLPLFHPDAETFFDYLPANALFLLDTDAESAARAHETEIHTRHQALSGGDPTLARLLPPESLYLSFATWEEHLAGFPSRSMRDDRQEPGESPDPGRIDDLTAPAQSPGTSPITAADPPESLGFTPIPALHRTPGVEQSQILARLMATLADELKTPRKLFLVARTVSQRERFREILQDHRLPTADAEGFAPEQAAFGVVHLALGDLLAGFTHAPSAITLIAEADILGPRSAVGKRMDRRLLDQIIAGFAELALGNRVVHNDHGIGEYGGLHTLAVGALKNDFLLIVYAGGDKLYVPVENLDRVGKYAGGEEAPLDRLGGTRWQKARQKAQRQVMAMADELLRLQAARHTGQAFAFSAPGPLDQEFAATFPFEETPDQAEAIRAVLTDMASPRAMDRLVCGDVGFGKTEVALRAVFRAVMEGKQVALLTPTTILAQQHFDTFSRRFAPYPVKVALLSRFRTPAQQKEALQAVARGEIEIVIGTHRLLQDDVAFKDLGLLVVDEEQRFGVTHKERIKALRATVDILTLTATPIPRTLHLAMAGVRDISIIATPPPERLSIRTLVTRFEPHTVREAILREIYRGGQVFYLHNQVQDIDKVSARIGELVPEAKIGIAHGQMRENQLERVMVAFYRREFQVLVCTTIIENGVDIPTANTIIIDRADKFGLAQLHQLRGRVGRAKHRAYAYLLVPDPNHLVGDAKKRLEALTSLSDLGAGFMLATHDLEIRGAGNILGEEQSGEIREVGLELYNQMLTEAIAALRDPGGVQEITTDGPESAAPAINLHLSTFIPDNYVPDVGQRLTLYKRIAQLAHAEAVAAMRDELLDRFGKLPESVHNLLQVVLCKRRCQHMGISKLEAGPKGGLIQFHPHAKVEPTTLVNLVRQGMGAYQFDSRDHTLRLKNHPWEENARRLEDLQKILDFLAGITETPLPVPPQPDPPKPQPVRAKKAPRPLRRFRFQ